jgi:hypothetical protein
MERARERGSSLERKGWGDDAPLDKEVVVSILSFLPREVIIIQLTTVDRSIDHGLSYLYPISN